MVRKCNCRLHYWVSSNLTICQCCVVIAPILAQFAWFWFGFYCINIKRNTKFHYGCFLSEIELFWLQGRFSWYWKFICQCLTGLILHVVLPKEIRHYFACTKIPTTKNNENCDGKWYICHGENWRQDNNLLHTTVWVNWIRPSNNSLSLYIPKYCSFISFAVVMLSRVLDGDIWYCCAIVPS